MSISGNHQDVVTVQLRQAGLKVTPVRRRLLEQLGRQTGPQSVRGLRDRIRPRPDRVTVYRCLQALVQTGLVQVERLGQEERYYLAQRPHHHVTCRSCARVECLPCRHDFSRIPNFTMVQHQLQLVGLCNHCAANGQP